jgi:hypothetical protein
MAESSLSITFTELQREVAFFLGWSRDPTAWDNTQSQDFADIHKRALRMFYYPPDEGERPTYEWTFLRKTGTITTVNNDYDYDLADDFGGTLLDSSTRFAATVNGVRPQLKKVDEQIIEQKRAMDLRYGVPRYFAVRNKAHSTTAGQRWEMLVYPTPSTNTSSASLVISFRYVFLPEQADTTNTYVVGGGQYSEVVLAAHLAAAEFKQDDEPNGPMMERFKELLKTAMRNDNNQKENNRGGGS